jgi:hypothetical protein
MPTIRVVTTIPASVELCFDLARNIELHRWNMWERRAG